MQEPINTFPFGTNIVELKSFVETQNPTLDPAMAKISECGEAIENMPPGKIGLVIGSGPNTNKWRERGWKTLDVNPRSSPDYLADANNLGSIFQPESLDYLVAEYITMHQVAGTPTKVRGSGVEYEPALGHERLISQASQILKERGKLIIFTVDLGNSEESHLPQSEEFAGLLIKHGFRPTLLISSIKDFADMAKRSEGQTVAWYAEKLSG